MKISFICPEISVSHPNRGTLFHLVFDSQDTWNLAFIPNSFGHFPNPPNLTLTALLSFSQLFLILLVPSLVYVTFPSFASLVTRLSSPRVKISGRPNPTALRRFHRGPNESKLLLFLHGDVFTWTERFVEAPQPYRLYLNTDAGSCTYDMWG
ncbi:hypothetical protein BKA64DRAFT_6910 [Cadophora sp. MPI-SDFR-AT-0126]|nr:hypothetical protein BKA64DRAFT_6910 [Leotiomycetes sp. MPI-SDFR-AT-0126]